MSLPVHQWIALGYLVVSFILMAVGLARLYKTCGLSRIWVLVPLLRIYNLARCARLEDAGILWLFFSIPTYVIAVLSQFFPNSWFGGEVAEFAALVLYVIAFFYALRIYLGVCKLFAKRRLWVFLWLLNLGYIPALVWGRDPDLHPHYPGSVLDTPADTEAARESGITADASDTGLSVNLNTRTVRDMLKTKCLLRDIHLNLQPGRMVLLLGGSGAGKTTLVNAIIGYEKADASMLLNGHDIYTEYEKMKYDIGMVPQQDLIRYDDTVLRTLTDAATLRLPESVTHRQLTERVNEVLEIFGLTQVRTSEVEKLSGGQKKRLSIATEFISDPALFVLDEPDSGLDGVLADDLMRRLRDISRQGKMVIVITHSPDRVVKYFDDIIVLAKDASGTGRLVFMGPIDEAREFFETDNIEQIVKIINRKDEGGEGRADELIEKFTEVRNNGKV